MLRYRLGLDLGANSLGWCLVELNDKNEPIRLIRMGARLFRDGRNPKDKQSLAVARRLARGMRRRRDRWLKRQRRFMDALIRHGLLPSDEASRRALVTLDPYDLRRKALDEVVPPHHVGRALFHLNQRRGFKSNRKVDKADEKESGKIKSALARVKESLTEKKVRTVGEWLALRHADRIPVRARLRGQGAQAAYDLYLGREMIAQEFDAIWSAQATHQPDIFTQAAGEELKEILLRQRPLRPVRPGRCTLEPEDERAPLALPSSQRFRILQELNNLRIERELGISESLRLTQRDVLASQLERSPKVTFDRMRRLLKLGGDTRFNLESEKRTELKGNAASLAMQEKGRFGDRWHELTLAQQDIIVEKLLEEESESALVSWLQDNTTLDEAAASKVANTGLPDSHINLGRRALAKVLPALLEQVRPYDKAVVAAGYQSHSQLHTGEIFRELPYYGIPLERHVGFGSGDPKDSDEKRYGRIANPTVHIGLNQVRRVVNAVIERYGPPTQIALEVTRELKQSADQRKRIEEEQAKNQKQNDEFRKELQELGLRDGGENLLRMKLWRELNINDPMDRRCPYTGRQIGREILFSDEVEIEHILPFARTLDDSIANKTLGFRDANRYKGNRTPSEAFGQSPDGYKWDDIQRRALQMPKNKQWRFAVNAIEEFESKHGNDFLARHLNDTAYLSRAAKAYLSYVCDPRDVWVTPGRLTALLRGKWGLNQLLSDGDKKDRTDHRHHAVDAAVIAVTDRGLLNEISRRSAQNRLEQLKDRILVPYPWDGYRAALETAIPRIVVSYKPDHGYQAGMHNCTAYGLAEPWEEKKRSQVVHRVPLATMGKKNVNELKPKDLDEIRDAEIKRQVKEAAGSKNGKELHQYLSEFAQRTGIHRIRVLKTITVIPIRRKGKETPYKAYKGDGNYCVEIYRDETGDWCDHIVTSFEANQIAITRGGVQRLRHKSLAQNGQPLVMRLCQDDVVAIGENDKRKIMRVVKFSKGKITLSEHFEGGDLKKRDEAKDDSFEYLTKAASSLCDVNARRVFITELGFVLDPGFKR
jgi:CRISPR-associated endonuclease Csn1